MFEPCPCGSGKTYLACCGRLHSGTSSRGAKEPVRSCYAAFARGMSAYLQKSWAAETQPSTLTLDPVRGWTGRRRDWSDLRQ